MKGILLHRNHKSLLSRFVVASVSFLVGVEDDDEGEDDERDGQRPQRDVCRVHDLVRLKLFGVPSEPLCDGGDD